MPLTVLCKITVQLYSNNTAVLLIGILRLTNSRSRHYYQYWWLWTTTTGNVICHDAVATVYESFTAA